MSTEDRFWSKVDRGGDCWLWTASLDKDGYGQFHYGDPNCGRRTLKAHRVSWELAGNALTGSLDHRYTCPKNCVNPAHLRIATQKQNVENFPGPRRDNTSGARGVFWSKQKRRWHVRVEHNRKQYHGGFFKDFAEAAEAAKRLRLKLHTHNDLDRA